jgi:hypothetical protein
MGGAIYWGGPEGAPSCKGRGRREPGLTRWGEASDRR